MSVFRKLAVATGLLLLVTNVEARERVIFQGGQYPGEIIVKQSERKLYLVLGDGTAIRYRVAVGKAAPGHRRARRESEKDSWNY